MLVYIFVIINTQTERERNTYDDDDDEEIKILSVFVKFQFFSPFLWRTEFSLRRESVSELSLLNGFWYIR